MIPAGQRKHKVTLYQPTITQNDEGGLEASYTERLETWAKIERTSENRTTDPSGTALLHTKDFLLLRTSEILGITQDWTLQYLGEDYVINEIALEPDERFVRITAKVKNYG